MLKKRNKEELSMNREDWEKLIYIDKKAAIKKRFLIAEAEDKNY